ncbi:MAG: hypothetical protein WC466_07380 [Candidatus Izemoplasmatales bacterium]
MKIFNSLIFVSLIAATSLFAYIPRVFALGEQNNPIYIQNANPFEAQNLVNQINNNINAAIEKILNAQLNAATKQRIATLNPECVKQVTQDIKERATDLNETNKMIEDYTKEHNSSDPITRQKDVAHLKYLTTARDMMVEHYTNLLIDTCSKQTTPSTNNYDQVCKGQFGVNSVWSGELSSDGRGYCKCDNGYSLNSQRTQCVATPPSGTLCNGKYWNGCSAGQQFYCPPTGDPECICSGDLILGKNKQCVTKTQSCKDDYGNNSIWSGNLNDTGGLICDCAQGYAWNANSATCIIQVSNAQANISKTIVATQEKKTTTQDKKTETEPIAVTDNAIEPISAPDETIATSSTSAITDMPEDNPKAIAKTDNTTPASKDDSWQPGLLQKFWTWVTSLFGFKN